MPEVIILCGKIASGKTTYAQQWCKQHPNTILLSVDDLMLSCYDTCIDRDAHVRMEQGILDYFYCLSEQLLHRGCDVMIDHGYWLSQERKSAYAYFAARNIIVKLHYLSVTQQVQQQRINMRKQKAQRNRYEAMEESTLHYLNGFFEALDTYDMAFLDDEAEIMNDYYG